MAKHKYSQHNKKTVGTIVGVFVLLMVVIIVVFGGNVEKNEKKYNENPNCMQVDYYDGKDGCLFSTITLTPDYQDVYSLHFTTYYMDSSESAEKKYQSLLKIIDENMIINQKETLNPDQSKVTYFLLSDHEIYFVVKNMTTVYISGGSDGEIDKKQRWFDVLRIDYDVPENI